MLNLPSALRTAFETCLRHAAIPKPAYAACTKWLRYYLDFCQKYHVPHAQPESLPRFLHKLQEKQQTKAQQQQASHAVSLYYELMCVRGVHSDVPSLTTDDPPAKALDVASHRPDALPTVTSASPTTSAVEKAPDQPSPQIVSSSNDADPSTGVSWIAVYTRLANDIQVRHYSPKTLKAYRQWVRHLQTFTRSKAPAALSSTDVREFLTWLAVHRKVSASTQNQAFNALLFFYRHVLNKEFAHSIRFSGGEFQRLADILPK
jgi:Phage integrase, N-terminal SAM-like domain